MVVFDDIILFDSTSSWFQATIIPPYSTYGILNLLKKSAFRLAALLKQENSRESVTISSDQTITWALQMERKMCTSTCTAHNNGNLDDTGLYRNCWIVQLPNMLTDQLEYSEISTLSALGDIHNCQHLNECTKHTFSDSPPPSESVHINIFQMDNLPRKW